MAGRPSSNNSLRFLTTRADEEDTTLEQLLLEHPDKGYEVYSRIRAHIARYQGYFIEWNPRQIKRLASKFYISKEKLLAVIETCMDEGLFSREMHNTYGILTSADIQNSWLRGIANSRRVKPYIYLEFSLFSPSILDEIKQLKTFLHYRIVGDVQEIFNKEGVVREDQDRIGYTIKITDYLTGGSPAIEAEEPVGDTEEYLGMGGKGGVPVGKEARRPVEGRYAGAINPLRPDYDYEIEMAYMRADAKLKRDTLLQHADWTEVDFYSFLEAYFVDTETKRQWDYWQHMISHFTNWISHETKRRRSKMADKLSNIKNAGNGVYPKDGNWDG